MIRFSLIALFLTITASFQASSAEFVGQIVMNYQSNSGEFHEFALLTGDKMLPLKFSSELERRKNKRKFRRQCGKVVKINGPLKKLSSSSQPYEFKNYLKIKYHSFPSSLKKMKGVIQVNPSARDYRSKYKIKEIDSRYSSSLPIILSMYHDNEFTEYYQDQEVEIEYSEFWISWRRIRFVSKIKLL
jgi:hypothetical protein